MPHQAPALPAGPAPAPLPANFTRADLAPHIETLRQAPARLRALTEPLSQAQLDTPYRNWTLRQIIHHIPDSHANAYIRFKLALTEPTPRIKPYNETAWSDLAVSKTAPIAGPLDLLQAVHASWLTLIESMSLEDFGRSFEHPEKNTLVRLADMLPSYAWHSAHHTAQIRWRLDHPD